MKICNRGQYLLELSAVLSVGLVFMVGVIDVSKAIHSYSSLQEAVNQSLRCVRATDGCVNVAAGNLEPEYQISIKTPEPRWPLYDQLYGGVAEWLEIPEHRLLPTAQVLNTVNYSIPGRRFNLQTPMYRPRATANFVKMQAAGVFADTEAGGALPATRDVVLRYARNSPGVNNNSYPSTLVPFGNRRRVSLSRTFVSSVLTAPSFNSDFQCLKTSDFNEPGGGTNSSPDYSWFCDDIGTSGGKLQRLNLVIHARGTSPSSNIGESKIRMTLIRLDGSNRQLGGAVFDSGGDASLVPRGLLPGYWSSSQGYQEFVDHQKITMRSGERFKIKLWMEYADDPDNEWRGDSLRIYFGRVFSDFVEGNCMNHEAETQHDCRVEFDPYDGKSKIAEPESLTNFHRTSEIVGYQQYQLANCKTYNYNSISNAAQEVQNQYQPQAPTNLYYAVVDRGCQDCSLDVTGDLYACMNDNSVKLNHTQQCPSNYGIADGMSSSAQASAATAICPPSHNGLSGYNPSEVYQSLTQQSVAMPQYSFNKLKTRCDQGMSDPNHNDWHSELQPYQNVSWSDSGTTGHTEEYYTGNLSPLEYKEQHPAQYGCFNTNAQAYGRNCEHPGTNAGCRNVPDHLPESSIMFGEKDQDCEYEEKVKNDPTILSDRASSMSGQQVYVNVLAPVDANLSTPQWVLEDPHDTMSCYDENPNYDHLADVPGELLPGVYTKPEIPEECHDGTWQCSLTYVGMRGDQAASSQTDTEQAIDRGLTFLETVLPFAKRHCEGANCVEFVIDETDPQNVIASARMNLPLNMLFNGTVPIRYAASVRPEKYLVK